MLFSKTTCGGLWIGCGIAAVWTTASAVYPGYDKYQQRITGREIRIFVLEPAGSDPAA